MKKVLLFSAAILALSSCSNTDVLEEGNIQQTNAIGFQTLVNKESRAINKPADLKNFQVFGSYTMGTSTNRIVIFNEVPVTFADGKWGYNDTRYWVKGGVYRFFAYSDDNSALKTGSADFGSGTGILNINNYISDADHQSDLVFVQSDERIGQDKGLNTPVDLTFKHALSRIMVTFKSGFPAGYDIKISNLKVTGLWNKGDYKTADFSTPHVWTLNEESTSNVAPAISLDANIAKAKDGETAAVDVVSGFAYVIPAKYVNKQVAIEFNMDVTYNGTEILGRKMKANWAPFWEINKQYNYTVTLNGTAAGLDPIEFTVTTFDDWATGTPTLENIDLGVELTEGN
jgi:hypothetical protein